MTLVSSISFIMCSASLVIRTESSSSRQPATCFHISNARNARDYAPLGRISRASSSILLDIAEGVQETQRFTNQAPRCREAREGHTDTPVEDEITRLLQAFHD